MPAMAHGRTPASPRAGADVEPAGVPQRWQNRAPGVSAAEHVEQIAPSSAVPQLEQKRPDASAPHDGHGFSVASDVGAADGLIGVVMRGK